MPAPVETPPFQPGEVVELYNMEGTDSSEYWAIYMKPCIFVTRQPSTRGDNLCIIQLVGSDRKISLFEWRLRRPLPKDVYATGFIEWYRQSIKAYGGHHAEQSSANAAT